MNRVKTCMLRGKRWRVRWRTEGGCAGMCTDPASTAKMITIAPRQTPQDLLETILHESLHACHWDLDEEAVDATAHDVTRLLWRIGYRVV